MKSFWTENIFYDDPWPSPETAGAAYKVPASSRGVSGYLRLFSKILFLFIVCFAILTPRLHADFGGSVMMKPPGSEELQGKAARQDVRKGVKAGSEKMARSVMGDEDNGTDFPASNQPSSDATADTLKDLTRDVASNPSPAVSNDRGNDAFPKIVLKDEIDRYQLGRVVQYIEDREGILTIDDITSQKSEKFWQDSRWDVPNFGFSNSAYWFRLKIENSLPDSRNWLFELGYAIHNELELYIYSADGSLDVRKASNLRPFSERKFKNMNFVFPVSIKPFETKTLYLKGKGSTSLQFPLALWSPEKFAQEKTSEYGGLFLYYGMILVMVFYNMFLYFTIGNINYLYYILYISSFFVFQSSLNGLAFQYLWPNNPWWANRCIPFFLGSLCFWLFLFSRNFLETKNNFPKLDKIFFILFISLPNALTPRV
ncbi:MAG: hypothetical protein HQK54_17870, partial [Oligoflexales bacterium]|nr:hypothetical protein [Oligoflexales bacterium]